MEYIVETNNLTKRFGKQKALDNVSLKIAKGSILGLVGKNGAGKTTFMRILAGLQFPTEGDFTLWGTNCADKEITAKRKRMGCLIEQPGIFEDLTAYGNLKVQYINLGMPSYDGIGDILKQVGLENTGKKFAGRFSLGMRQRLGIAIAMAGSPDLLILDEPINGLDPEAIVEIREMLLKLNREKGTTILISSHILTELEHLATEYAFIDKGSIVQQISAEEMRNKCRRSTLLTVTDTKAACRILDDIPVEYEVKEERKLAVYGDFKIGDFVLELSKTGGELVESSVTNENLESYYLEIIGGKND